MIGLGSNRLSVCRRGGMSVTQAGRGGMEWLGVRYPSWASPYSSQATAALKALYPNDYKDILNYGFQHPEVIDYVNTTPAIGIWLIQYVGFHDILVNNHLTFETPIIAADATSNSEKMWLIRNYYNYTDWNSLSNIMDQIDWQYLLGGFSSNGLNFVSQCGTTKSSPGTLVRFFVPTSMPTGYDEVDADTITICINGTNIFTGTHRNRTKVSYDFSNIIKLNEPNYVAITWTGSGRHGIDFGFY